MNNIENALIESTYLGWEDHGIFSIGVNFSGPGWGQGTGQYGFSVEFAKGVCKAVGVQSWEQLKGKHCRVRRDGHFIAAIGSLMKDDWYELPRGAK